MTQKIRPLYEQFGAEGYYRAFADTYENPHQPEIEALVARNMPRLDCSGTVLDLGAGGGEVSRALLQAGVADVQGCDPFTHALYVRNTGLPCLTLSFRDIMLNGLPHRYSLIISSFALHLCPPKDLYLLSWQLFQSAPVLVVITPHKRPELEQLPGVTLLWEDTAETEKGKRVRMKAYGMTQEA